MHVFDAETVLSGLKDFQRDTVEYVFRRMYLDDKPIRRFLVADEVGLGKTLVARGLIAKAIEHLKGRTDRIDIVYVCSNADIARQNIERLNVTGDSGFSLASRITLMPLDLPSLSNNSVNFISFTPGTSFDLKDSAGQARERVLLYWLVADAWQANPRKATRVFEGYTGTEAFRAQVRKFDRSRIQPDIQSQYLQDLATRRPELRTEFEGLCERMPRAGVDPSRELRRKEVQFVGKMRRQLAETCLHWLQPDLIILDEFQRFKHLLCNEGEEASDAAQLAEHLFSYQQEHADPATAARVLLLSATPYKMYTLTHESVEDDHYADFRQTMRFLLDQDTDRQQLQSLIGQYREGLLRLTVVTSADLARAKCALETALCKVVVRTERLAITADRNGMLVDVANAGLTLDTKDIRQYLAVQRLAEVLGHEDVLEYWKSSPYLLNFMENYDLKSKFRKAIQDPGVRRVARAISNTLLKPEDIARYKALDPANPRLRSLHADTIGRGAWRLLWVPPALPYYAGTGAFAEPELRSFTKRLVFSCWKVVPKTIAAVLSYEAERCMIGRVGQNSIRAMKDRRPLLRFTFSKGRPRGMAVLGLLYPCQILAERLDPLRHRVGTAGPEQLRSAEDVLTETATQVRSLLAPLISQFGSADGATDERWYWAAPLLLDLETDENGNPQHWALKEHAADIWYGSSQDADERAARGWKRHVRIAREVLTGKERLGAPPDDLERVVAEMALASPGVVALRALQRVLAALPGPATDLRDSAAPLAHAFLHLFNLPEVIELIRGRRRDVPYWKLVLDYCVSGNLQSVIDEHAHMLLESCNLQRHAPAEAAQKIGAAIQSSLGIRSSTTKADVVEFGARSLKLTDEPLRLRTRFAMRFGDQETDQDGQVTRGDHVRLAFNSPFWPFVLATTSVGQEGLDFHPYCHAVVHWNLPSNPVDLEQRDGRVHRYKGHAIRKNVAHTHAQSLASDFADPWAVMFTAACAASHSSGQNDLDPYWVYAQGPARIERHVPMLPLSREVERFAALKKSLVAYRMVFGQSRQDDLVEYLLSRFSGDEVEEFLQLCRIDLSPPRPALPCATVGPLSDGAHGG